MEQEVAVVTMYQYYIANKQTLPSNISTFREFIVNELVKGEDVASVFKIAGQKAIEMMPTSWGKAKRTKKKSL